ncbi:Superoxide dismutase [Cu-Zn] [Pseudogymnoascus australis]
MVKAVATVRGDSKVSGTVTFEQADENSSTTISWNLTGNDANAQRGIHVHQFGDNTNGCTSAGPHCEKKREMRKNDQTNQTLRGGKTIKLTSFPVNPRGKNHGAPTDEERHVGDLGNFSTDAQGNSTGTTTDKLIKLIGPDSVIGVSHPSSCPPSYPSGSNLLRVELAEEQQNKTPS